jgi:hypothetical protein
LITFELWRTFPDRTAFLVFGIVAVVALAAGMQWAARRGYFVDRRDLILHGLVVVDVALEAASFEGFNAASQCLLCAPGDASTFHNHYNFCWCSAILAVLVGGHHWWALRREARSCNGANRNSQSPRSPTDEATAL